MLAYFLHDFDPFAIRFADHWFTTWIPYLFHLIGIDPTGIRWYGISYLTGFICAFLLLRYLAGPRGGNQLRMPRDKVADFVLNMCIFGVLVGGRLGYVLFYDRSLLLFDGAFPYWGVLKVWQGGMSAHGGVVGVVIAIAIFSRWHKFSLVNLGDAACMVVPLGLLFGRLANFVNGELYGHVTNVAWAVKFPTEISNPTNGKLASYLGKYDDSGQFTNAPALRDAVVNMGNAINDLCYEYKLPALPETRDQLVRYFYRPEEILPASIHADPQKIEQVRTVLHQQLDTVLQPRHPSQLYEACLEGLLLFLLCWTIGRVWKKDGMASGAFLVFYPIMRIIGEQFRVGDTPQEIFGFTVSKGILYSAPMLLIGLVYWGYWMRKPGRKLQPAAVAAPEVKN